MLNIGPLRLDDELEGEEQEEEVQVVAATVVATVTATLVTMDGMVARARLNTRQGSCAKNLK